jgi:hypothetical protein
MKNIVNAMFAAAILAITITAQAASVSRSKAIIVEAPADLPEAAQVASEAIYLHDTNDGRALLYLEQNDGKRLSILDVSDPAQIKAIGRVSIAAASPFDFVQQVGDTVVLIRYRDHSGFATLDLRHAKSPVVGTATGVMNAGFTQTLGQTGLLLTSASTVAQAPQNARMYQVVDMSSASHPALLGTVNGVKQSVSNSATGTLYLLGDGGVTVVRQTAVEDEHATEQMQQRGN